jgi:hypothetical protein
MKNIKVLIPYNLCLIFSQIYSLNNFDLNQTNPSKRLPNVITISVIFQLCALLISQTINSSYYQVMNHLFKSI